MIVDLTRPIPYIDFSQTNHMNSKVAQHLSVPENRLRYVFRFLNEFSSEFIDTAKCYDSIAQWSEELDTSEAHY